MTSTYLSTLVNFHPSSYYLNSLLWVFYSPRTYSCHPTWVLMIPSHPCHSQQGGRCSRERPSEKPQHWESTKERCDGGCPFQAAPWPWSWRVSLWSRKFGTCRNSQIQSCFFLHSGHFGQTGADATIFLLTVIQIGEPRRVNYREKPPALGRELGRPASRSLGSWWAESIAGLNRQDSATGKAYKGWSQGCPGLGERFSTSLLNERPRAILTGLGLPASWAWQNFEQSEVWQHNLLQRLFHLP